MEKCIRIFKELIESLRDLAVLESERKVTWHMCHDHGDKIACDQMRASEKILIDVKRKIRSAVDELTMCMRDLQSDIDYLLSVVE